MHSILVEIVDMNGTDAAQRFPSQDISVPAKGFVTLSVLLGTRAIGINPNRRSFDIVGHDSGVAISCDDGSSGSPVNYV
jgi:hypothetical protein